MDHFLTQTARDILERHEDLQKVGIILPSRRASVFLKRELVGQLETPIWSPYISTVEDFLMEQLKWEQADQAGLMFTLYESYSSVLGSKAESFGEFSQWSHLLLADFNEVDRYLIDAHELFHYLSDVERIKRWNLDPDWEHSDLLESYLKLWESIPAIYDHFTARLRADKQVYQGMAYREMAENVEAHLSRLKSRFSKLIFIGFSALNTAEEDILLKLYREGLADFYWDVDEYYFNNPIQEAGSFLRKSKLVSELIDKEDFKWQHQALSTVSKKVVIHQVNGSQQMAVKANAAALEFQDAGLENVAIVLADEELLPLFLNNLAKDIEALNITMGIPLAQTPAAGFFQLLMNMVQEHEHTQRNDTSSNPAFHFQKWDDLLSHHLFKMWSGNADLSELLRQQIRKKNRIFISADELVEWSEGQLPSHIPNFFSEALGGSINQLWSGFSAIAEYLNEQHQNKDVLLQSLFGFFKLFNRLGLLMEEHSFITDIKTASRFYRDLLRIETLDIYGEPLIGLQLMGMLETRTLDFKNLIITSLNEDILPKGRSENSLIPFDIKREFGLPTYLEKDAVFAYHFYRLLQRAENVHLLYDGTAEGLGSGEASRFIRQLQQEAGANFSFEERQPTFKIKSAKTDDILIDKTEGVMQRLQQMSETGFSATALIDYINDPIQFYQKRVLRLQEADEVEEVAGYDTQGNVIHELLESFYSEGGSKGTAKSALSPEDPIFSQGQATLRKLVVDGLSNEAGLSDLNKGKNLLIREILVKMLSNFLSREKRELQKAEESGISLQLVGLEQELVSILDLGDGVQVKLKGVIDRIDNYGGELRLIDYKTGKVEATNLSLREMDDMRQPDTKNKSLQLMLYAWLFFRNEERYDQIIPAIISLRDINSWLMPLKWKSKPGVNRTDMPDFEGFLRALLKEILNPDIPFGKKPLNLVDNV